MNKVIAIFAIAFSINVQANTAYVPLAFHSKNETQSSRACFYMTNITDGDIDATFSLFSSDGTKYYPEIEQATYIQTIGEPFKVPPRGTGSFCLKNQPPVYIGSGQIDVVATSGFNRSQLMVAQGNLLIYLSGKNATTSAIVINGGMPF
ncbi:hypothetical protein [Aeromonas dhakensis]|uniref:hypothetical protein n=1 Tax=Aeromonas dhakensis TaxID=196024 RepID=UPI00300DDC4E